MESREQYRVKISVAPCGKALGVTTRFIAVATSVKPPEEKLSAALPTFALTGVRDAVARSTDEPDSVHHASPNPLTRTAALITSALLGLIFVLPKEELIDTTGAEGARIMIVTEAEADLVWSETTMENVEVVPLDCGLASTVNAELVNAADPMAKAQVELNDGADCEQDHA